MATRRKNESEQDFHQRVSAYMRSYNTKRNEKAKAEGFKSYGQRRYRTQTKPKLQSAQLNRYKTWRRATRGTIPPQYVADWFRRGLLKHGHASPSQVQARANFLAYATLRREGIARPSKSRILDRASLGSHRLGPMATGDPDLKHEASEEPQGITIGDQFYSMELREFDTDEPFFDWAEWREDYKAAS